MRKRLFAFLLATFLLAGCLPPPSTKPRVAVTTTRPLDTPSSTLEPTLVLREATPMPLTAVLNEVQGDVEAMLPTESAFSPAQNGMTLPEESQVMTMEESYARLDLSSGTIIRMAPLSLFTITNNETMNSGGLLTRLHLIAGKLWIILTEGIVEVETPSGLASVHGSYMMVEMDTETQNMLVSCLEGNCELVTPAGHYILSTGEKARLIHPSQAQGEYLPPILEPLSETDIQSWVEFNPEAREILPFVQSVIASRTPILDRTPIVEATRTPILGGNDDEPTRTPIRDRPTRTPRR